MRNRLKSWQRKSTTPTVKLRNITGKGKRSMLSVRKNAYIVKRKDVTKKKMISAIERKIVADYTKKVIVIETKKIDVATNKPLERLKSSIPQLISRLENTL